VHLAAVLDGVNMYLQLITLIKHYSIRYMANGGWEGLDGDGWLWMMYSINRTHHQLGAWESPSLLGTFFHKNLCLLKYI
jgi:hypothetical protein